MDKSSTKNSKTVIIIVIIGVLIGAGTGLLAYFLSRPPAKTEDTQGVVGVIRDDWDYSVSRKESDADQPSRSGTKIPGYSSAVMKAGDKTLTLSIGNPKENQVGFYATVKLFDGTVLYESPLLEPGQGLTEIPLNGTLEKGIYDAMVYYRCVSLDKSHKPLNSAESGFKLYVN